MTTAQLLFKLWNWQPSVLLGCAALLVIYAAAWHVAQVPRGEFPKVLLFLAGDLALLLALVSPLDRLGDDYLFSAHMLQHLLLLQVTPPLLILGLSEPIARRALGWRPLRNGLRLLGRPAIAWSMGVLAVWIWHVPALYNAALANEQIHLVEHLCFLVTATVFWWPVMAPIQEARPAPLPALLYLFLGMAASALLGILITFVPAGWYPTYVHPNDDLGILPLLRQGWGLTPAADQQLAGLLMWIPGSLIYLLAAFGALGRWLAEPEEVGASDWEPAVESWRLAVEAQSNTAINPEES